MTLNKLVLNEVRYRQQIKLLQRYGAPVLSCSLRLPGELAAYPEARALLDELEETVSGPFAAKTNRLLKLKEGSLLLSVSLEAGELKQLVLELEAAPGGLFFDLDVISTDAKPLSRQMLGLAPRPCIVCGCAAKLCLRARAHLRSEVVKSFEQALEDYYLGRPAQRQALRVAEAATAAALFEAAIYPAPGLVSPFDRGSHDDMDFGTFIFSSLALHEVFAAFFVAGQEQQKPALLFRRLRAIGNCGERKMYRATAGVNTHKGLIFTLGIITGALGAVGLEAGGEAISAYIRSMCRGIVQRELPGAGQGATAGERAYRDYGVTGIRGEAERGFPLVFELAIPAINHALARGLSLNDALVQALVALMARVEDTTLIKRGGIEAFRQSQKKASGILLSGGMHSPQGRQAIMALHRQFCQHKLNAGGAADLLAAAFFFILLAGNHPAQLNKNLNGWQRPGS